MKLVLLFVSVLALVLPPLADAMMMPPENVPVRRLVEMAEDALRKAPESAEANYTLARIHYLAFVCAAEKLTAYLPQEKRPLQVGPYQYFTTANRDVALMEEAQKRTLVEMKLKTPPRYDTAVGKQFWAQFILTQKRMEKSGWNPGDLPDAEAAAHVSAAITSFQAAHRLTPKNALYRLGYASLLEQARAWRERHPAAAAVPAAVRAITPAAVRAEYRRAWEMELTADLKDKERGAFGLMDMVSYEAGKAFVRLAEAEAGALPAEEKPALEKARASLVDLGNGRMRMVTPLVFATRAVGSIAELLATDTTVEFPLRGWGPAERWPWVKPATALLVWNPSGSGRVRSGAQLFGSYTWELFWATGYEPLAVLDADGDGALRGAELDGLAAWRDADGDGVADPGEVEPLAALGVTALATVATGAEGPHPMNARGVTFTDGRTLPTWDWMAEPLARPEEGRRLTQAGP